VAANINKRPNAFSTEITRTIIKMSTYRGSMEKLVIVVIPLILLTESLDRKHVTRVYVYINEMMAFFIIVRVISVENTLYLKNGLC